MPSWPRPILPRPVQTCSVSPRSILARLVHVKRRSALSRRARSLSASANGANPGERRVRGRWRFFPHLLRLLGYHRTMVTAAVTAEVAVTDPVPISAPAIVPVTAPGTDAVTVTAPVPDPISAAVTSPVSITVSVTSLNTAATTVTAPITVTASVTALVTANANTAAAEAPAPQPPSPVLARRLAPAAQNISGTTPLQPNAASTEFSQQGTVVKIPGFFGAGVFSNGFA